MTRISILMKISVCGSKHFAPNPTVQLAWIYFRSWDRIYCTLPLYHSSGQWMALGVTILSGATLLLRSKFSATQFWIDCVQYKATCAQYIGEMCRFLLGKYDQK